MVLKNSDAPCILLLEDELSVLETLVKYFQRQGYRTISARSGEEALDRFDLTQCDAVILDIMLQEGPSGGTGLDGLETCRELRRMGFTRPVLFLTARRDETATLQGFAAGADDYVTKPFSLSVLKARLEALLRRVGAVKTSYRFGEVFIDLDRYTIRHPDRSVRLRSRERDLLRCFLENRGKILSREELLLQVWDDPHRTSNRTVDTHVRTLRKKLGDNATNPRFIETMHGVGYQFIANAD
ncbi:MAG: response regulator transcription factor [Myxococcota bacterium]